MKKVKVILSNFMNMSIKLYPSNESIQLIYGTAQIIKIAEEQQAIPFIIEIECFEE